MEIPEPMNIDQDEQEDESGLEESVRLEGFMNNAWWRSLSESIVENGVDQNGDLIKDDVLQVLNTDNWWGTYESIYAVVSKGLNFIIPRSVRHKQPGSALVRKERLADFLATKYGHDGAYVIEEEA